MNEVIEQLIDKFETECHLSFDCIEREKFEQAIQTACKAQRNACVQAYKDECISPSRWHINAILNAEIERCDYE